MRRWLLADAALTVLVCVIASASCATRTAPAHVPVVGACSVPPPDGRGILVQPGESMWFNAVNGVGGGTMWITNESRP